MYRVVLLVSPEYIPSFTQSFRCNYPNYTIDFVISKEIPWNCSKKERNTLWICDSDSSIRRIKEAFCRSDACNNPHGSSYINPPLIPVIAFSHEKNKRESLISAPWMILSPEGLTPDLIEEILYRCSGRPIQVAETSRLILRELSMDDLPKLLSLQEENIKNPGGLFFREEDTAPDRFLNNYIRQQYYYYGFGLYSISISCTDTMAGIAGFSCTDLPGIDAEISYALFKKYQHKGYAREAVRALLEANPMRWQFKHLAARISPANPSSLKLAKDLGIEVFLIDSQEEDGPDLN